MQIIHSLLRWAGQQWEKALTLSGILLVLLPTSPLNLKYTYRDSGVFLYTGWRILQGELPYRDIWDHKPPVIFYINAAGLALADNSRWGVWLLEVLFLFAAAWMGYKLIRKLFGTLPALFSLLLWLLALTRILQGGNFTTEYTLPLQFAALWLLHDLVNRKPRNAHFLLLGAAGALAFFTKQTAIGIWLAAALYLLLQRSFTGQYKPLRKEFTLLLLGGVGVALPIVVFFLVQDGLPQFWSASFEYNVLYSSRSQFAVMPRLDALIKGLRPLTNSSLFPIAAAGYTAAVVYVLFHKTDSNGYKPLLITGLINLPLELLLIALPQKTYPHYFMTLLPVLALFSAFAGWAALSWISSWKISKPAGAALALVVLTLILWNAWDGYLAQVYAYRTFDKDREMIEYITRETAPGDSILIWGAEASIHYFTERKSPTRFVYQYPLQREGYVDESMAAEFLEDILEGRPKLILNNDPSSPLFEFPVHSRSLDETIEHILSHYCLISEDGEWLIQEYSENGCAP